MPRMKDDERAVRELLESGADLAAIPNRLNMPADHVKYLVRKIADTPGRPRAQAPEPAPGAGKPIGRGARSRGVVGPSQPMTTDEVPSDGDVPGQRGAGVVDQN